MISLKENFLLRSVGLCFCFMLVFVCLFDYIINNNKMTVLPCKMKRNSVFKISVPSEEGSLIRSSASVSFP